MAASYANSSCRSLRALPAEMLLEISKYITDFDSLHGFFTFLTGHPGGLGFFEIFQTGIFANVLSQSRDEDLTSVITAVMTLRSDAMSKEMLPTKTYEAEGFDYNYLRSPDTERNGKSHYLQRFSDPVATVRDIWQISQDIEKLVRVFAEMCIVVPSELGERRSASSTELHRIRRAFWCFQFCYDTCHPERVPSEAESAKYPHTMTQKPCSPGTERPRHTGENPKDFVDQFTGSLCYWEEEEFEAVRSYLRCLINNLKYGTRTDPSRLRLQPALIQRLLNDPEYWRRNGGKDFDHVLVANSQLGRPKYQLSLERWPYLGIANEANVYFELFTSLTLLGWRMWDEERLVMRGLIYDTAGDDPLGGVHLLLGEPVVEGDQAQSTCLNRWVAEVCQTDDELGKAKCESTGGKSNKRKEQ